MRIHKVHIVAEGPSEKAYFTHLSRICRELDIPLLFTAYPSDGISPKKIKKQWCEAQIRRDQKHNEEVWAVLDYDCFARGDVNINSFRFTGGRLYFFVMNFEDFLVQHLAESDLKKWKNICLRRSHFISPMHGDVVVREIQHVIPGYKKGTMPFELQLSHLISADNNKGHFHSCSNITDFMPIFIAFLKLKNVI